MRKVITVQRPAHFKLFNAAVAIVHFFEMRKSNIVSVLYYDNSWF